MYDKLKHYFLLLFNTPILFMHFQWPVVYCFIVDENIHYINISGMYVCKKSKMYKQSINNDDKNNDDDDDDDHNILLLSRTQIIFKIHCYCTYSVQLYLVQCDRGHIHVVLSVLLCID